MPRSPLYMLWSLSAFVSCHCNHPKKKLFIGANSLQPMTGARCTLWWVRRRCKTGLKRFSGPDSFILPLLWLKDVAERMGMCPCSGLWNPRYHPPLKLQQIREAFCSDSAESVHSSSVVSFHKQNPVVPVAHDLKGITRSFFFSSLHVSPLHTHLCL